MTANNVQGSNILDVLKKKMRATKEECEKFKEDAEDLQRKLQVEISRREEVSFFLTYLTRKLVETASNQPLLRSIYLLLHDLVFEVTGTFIIDQTTTWYFNPFGLYHYVIWHFGCFRKIKAYFNTLH